MVKLLVVVSVVLLEIALLQAQVPRFGGCPDIQPIQNFDVTKYLGLWYEQKRYFAIFEAGGKCVTAQYTDLGEGKVGVNNTMFNTFTSSWKSIQGEATMDGKDGEGKLAVRFPSAGGFAAPYVVVGTDYDSYSVVWSCTDLLQVTNAQFGWLLTREKDPSAATWAKINEIITTTGIESGPFSTTAQDCDE